jgi:hypothetical protein
MVRKQRRRRHVPRSAPNIHLPEPSLETAIQDLARGYAEKVTVAIRSSIEELAEGFAEDILASVRGTRLSEIVSAEIRQTSHEDWVTRRARQELNGNAATSGVLVLPSGKGRKRTRAEMDEFVHEVVELCKQHEDGIHAEEMRAILKVRSQDLQRPITLALKAKKIKKTGQKRSTLYFAN